MDRLPNFILFEIFAILSDKDLCRLNGINKTISQTIRTIQQMELNFNNSPYPEGVPPSFNSNVKVLTLEYPNTNTPEPQELKQLYPNVSYLTTVCFLKYQFAQLYSLVDLFPLLKSMTLFRISSIEDFLPILAKSNRLTQLVLTIDLPSAILFKYLISHLPITLLTLSITSAIIPDNILPKLSNVLPNLESLRLECDAFVPDEESILGIPFKKLTTLVFIVVQKPNAVFLNPFYFPTLKVIKTDCMLSFNEENASNSIFFSQDQTNFVDLSINLQARFAYNLLQSLTLDYSNFTEPGSLVNILANCSVLTKLKLTNIKDSFLNDQFDELSKYEPPIYHNLTHLYLELKTNFIQQASFSSTYPPLQFLTKFKTLFSLSIILGLPIPDLLLINNLFLNTTTEDDNLNSIRHLKMAGFSSLAQSVYFCLSFEQLEILDYFCIKSQSKLPQLKANLKDAYPNLIINPRSINSADVFA